MQQFFPEGFEDFYKGITHFPSRNMDNIAVIFSSAKLLKYEYGQEIDSFSNILRFNMAPIVGYEKNVGTKTTHRLLNDKARYKEKDEKCLIAESMGNFFIKHVMRDFSISQHPNNKEFFEEFYLLNRQFQNVIFSFLFKNFNIQYMNYSSGFIGLFYGIFSSKTPPVLYGFQTMEELRNSSGDHYYNVEAALQNDENFIGKTNRSILKEYKKRFEGKVNLMHNNPVHDFKLEKDLISILAQRNIIVIKD